jgi:hypothetical protein
VKPGLLVKAQTKVCATFYHNQWWHRLQPVQRRLKAGGSQDWLPHISNKPGLANLWLLAALLLVFALSARAQEGGQAEVALQGYYLGGPNQTLLGTTGVAVKFQQFFPDFGLIRGNLEAYRTGGTIQPADNFLELRGLVLGGLRWNVTAGDFRSPASLIPNPFTNLFFPEIDARGARIEAGDSRSSYTLFYGNETLLGGPRIPFRINAPQQAMGAAMRQKFGHLETGVRILHLTAKESDLEGNSFFFPAGRSFLSADNLTVYTSYTFSDHFRWYGEATAARVQTIDAGPTVQPISYFFGPAWESPRLTIRANYANLGNSYLPVAGYAIGDRKGPFGEVRFRPVRRVELFASASHYETTEKHDPVIPYIRSTGTSAGASFELPWQVSASGQLSTIQFYSLEPKSGLEQNSRNRQWTGTLSRQFGHQTLRLTARDTRLMMSGSLDRQRSEEFEDTLQFHRLVLSGAVRSQQDIATEHRNSVYLRGSAQINLGRLTAYGYFEGGKDLVNQSIFATNTTSSSVVSATLRLTPKWSIQGEAFRSKFIASLNPESLFVQGNQGVFVDPVLSRFNQWSVLFRVVRSFNWGSAIPNGNVDEYMRRRIPLTGSVEGLVHVLASGGVRPAPGIAVTLESGQSAKTDVDGRYRFESVAEGAHTVSINMEELPADYNPGEKTKSPVTVGTRKSSRVDLELYALSAFVGKVAVLPGSVFESLEGIVVRMEPGQRYTTTLRDGSFAFYNTPDGDYQLRMDESTLPPEARLQSAPNATVVIRTGGVPATVQFEIDRIPVQEKRIRKVLEQRIESAFSAPLMDVRKPPQPPVPTTLPTAPPTATNAPAPATTAPAPATTATAPATTEPRADDGIVKNSDFSNAPSRSRRGDISGMPTPQPPALQSAEAYNARGRELIAQGKYHEAIAELSAALRQDPNFTLALNARGFAYYLIRDYKRSLADFDAAIRLNPQYDNAYLNRSKARRAAGDAAGSAADSKRRKSLKSES